MLSGDILEKITNMIKSINLNLSTIQEINNRIKAKNINIDNKNSSDFLIVWLREEIKKLTNIYNDITLNKDEKHVYLGIMIKKLTIFVNNFTITDSNLDKKIVELQNSNDKLLSKLIPSEYNNYFESLDKIEFYLEKLIRNNFLKESEIDYNKLEEYNRILNEYNSLISQYYKIEVDLNNSDRIDFKNFLLDNYRKLNENFKKILLNILDNDSLALIDNNLFLKIRKLIDQGNYDYILKNKILSIEITNEDMRSKLDSELKDLILELSKIKDEYKVRKMDKNQLKIDYPIGKKAYVLKDKLKNIDIPKFINEAYDEKRKTNLKKYKIDADNLEKKLTRDGNLTVGNLRKLKKIRNIIKNSASSKKVVSKLNLRNVPKNGKFQKNNPYTHIQNKDRQFK